MEISFDTILEEKFCIVQPKHGFRFSSDPVYLSWFIRFRKNAQVVDIGSGSGIISVLLAGKKGFENIDAVELQPEMYDCLCKTVRESGMENVINTIQSDIKMYAPEKQYDIAVCNPPYKDPSTGRLSVIQTELNARFTTTMHVRDVFSFCRSRLKNSGSLYLCYDADLIADLFECGLEYGFEPKRLMPVCGDTGMRPKTVLMEFVKNSGRGLVFEPPLLLKINGEPSKLAEKILKGDWDD